MREDRAKRNIVVLSRIESETERKRKEHSQFIRRSRIHEPNKVDLVPALSRVCNVKFAFETKSPFRSPQL